MRRIHWQMYDIARVTHFLVAPTGKFNLPLQYNQRFMRVVDMPIMDFVWRVFLYFDFPLGR